jgi:hypothetical protein
MRKQWMAAAMMVVGLGAGTAMADGMKVSGSAGELSFSGKVYTDFTYKQNVDEGAEATSKDSGTGFDLKRFYLGADYAYNEFLSARFRTDIGDQNGKFDVFVKHAFVQLKFCSGFWLRAGAADLPWVPFVEDRYGFRYVENTLIDRTGFGTSADWGLHVGGDLVGKMVSYSLSVVNGKGYANPSRSQAPTVEARVSVQPIKDLYFAVGGQVGTLGQKEAGVPTAETASRVQAMASYATGMFRVGAEGFYGKNDQAAIVTGKAPSDSALGFSGWAAVQLAPTLKPTVFGRFDYVQPSMDVNEDLKDVYFNAGLEITPVEQLKVSLVYKRDHVSTGALPGSWKSTNGVVGSTLPNSGGTYQEFGVWSQLVF